MYLRIAAAVTIAIASWSVSSQADLTVKYRATHAELMLFKQPQEPPFGRMSYTLYLSGPKVRTEMVDAFGREWWFIADRTSGTAFTLDPEHKQYWAENPAWSCAGLADHVAIAAHRLLQNAGVTDLAVTEMETGDSIAGVATTGAALRFTGRVLGLPQPMASELDLYFPRSEERAFGSGCTSDLYCGPRPSSAVWAAALQKRTGLEPQAATFLGEMMTVPMRLALRVNMSVGHAALTLDAAGISNDPISPALFEIPADFTERP